MSNIKRRVKWNKHGVSEIIGNILILGITVTLFSSIMWFVTAMPTPQEHAYADMTSNLITDYSPSTGGWASISVSHKGGQELKNASTGIYIWINDTTLLRYKITDSNPNIGTSWTAGEVWRINLTSAIFPVGNDPSRARISLMITDTQKNSEVYTVTLNGGGSLTSPSPPIIGSRGTTPTPTYMGDAFYYYVTVTDPNNDLNKNSVYLDASSINPSWGSLKMTDSNNDGVFTVASPAVAELSWNGKAAIVNASDTSGHSATGRITLSIFYKSGGGSNVNSGMYFNYSSYFVNGTYPPDATGGESGGAGGAAGTTFYYVRHLPDMVITRNFQAGDQVMIEIYSDTLANLALENDFYLFHPLTNNLITPPSSSGAFLYGGIYGTFHRYVYNFTVPSTSLIYPIQIKLKDNTGTVTNIVDQISVGSAKYPSIQLYKADSSGNYIATNNFNITDRVYVRLVTKDVDPAITTVSVGTVEISDYTGRYIIKATPSSSTAYPSAPNYVAPISSVYKTGTTSSTRLADNNQASTTKYTIYLNLNDAYQGSWLPRTNAYTFRVSLLTDNGPATGEIYYGMTTQLNITAPLTTTDIVASVGSGSYTWSSTGASWTNNKIVWYSNVEGNGQWAKTTISDPTYNGPLGVVLTDINNDGYNDVVVAYQDVSVSIAYYLNEASDGSEWSETPHLICSAFDAVTGTQAANNGDRGTANEDVSVYTGKTNNRNRFYGDDGDICLNELVMSMASGDFDQDGDMDLVASFTHVVTYTDASNRPDADWSNSRPMFFNRGVYVFWNEGSWVKTQIYGTSTYTNQDTNPAAQDLSVADFNQDGYPDIVAIYEDGTTKVWMNRFMETTGDKRAGAFGTAASLINVTPTVAGTLPWRWDTPNPSTWPLNYAMAKVETDQIGYGNYPDIVRTSTASNAVTVLYTTATTNTQTNAYPNLFSGVGSASGSIANLTANDTKWQNLTEVYQNYPVDVANPIAKGISDDTLQPLSNLWYNDGSTYQVDGFKTMYLTAFNPNASYAGKIIASAWLTVKYSADSTYDGTQSLKISTNEGATTITTNITPLSNDLNKVGWFNLLANGVNTYSKIASLDVSFASNAPVGHGSVRIDYIWLNVEFVQTRVLDWKWSLNNTITAPMHELIVVAKLGSAGENFELMYSPDNENWFNLTDISTTTQTTRTFQLDYSTNSVYYLRVVDLNRGAAESGDLTNNTVCFNYVYLRNYMPQVTWLATDKTDIAPITGLGSGLTEERVTSIAIADLGKISGDHTPDGFPDIVVGTTKVGSGDSTHSVYILAQTGEKSFTATSVATTNLATQVASNSIYDVNGLAVGDMNGDNIMDIVVVIGFSGGQSTSTPAATLWIIENEPLPLAWQFSDSAVNTLGANEAAINAVTGNIDLAIFMPFLGVLGVLAAEAITRNRKK